MMLMRIVHSEIYQTVQWQYPREEWESLENLLVSYSQLNPQDRHEDELQSSSGVNR